MDGQCKDKDLAYSEDSVFVGCLQASVGQINSTYEERCNEYAQRLNTSTEDSRFRACLEEYITEWSQDVSQACIEYLAPIIPENYTVDLNLQQLAIQYDITIPRPPGEHVLYTSDLYENLSYTLGLLPPGMFDYKKMQIAFYEFTNSGENGDYLGYTYSNGNIYISNYASCDSEANIDSRITCNTFPAVATMIQVTLHEIMHNQDDRVISSEYCPDSNTCTALEAFVGAAAQSEYPLFFNADGSLDVDTLENDLYFQTGSPSTDREHFAEYGATYVMNPEGLQQNFLPIYDVFQEVYYEYTYSVEPDSDGMYLIQPSQPVQ